MHVIGRHIHISGATGHGQEPQVLFIPYGKGHSPKREAFNSSDNFYSGPGCGILKLSLATFAREEISFVPKKETLINFQPLKLTE